MGGGVQFSIEEEGERRDTFLPARRRERSIREEKIKGCSSSTEKKREGRERPSNPLLAKEDRSLLSLEKMGGRKKKKEEALSQIFLTLDEKKGKRKRGGKRQK